MTTLTIPKNLAKMGDLVLVPRKEYENLLKRRVVKEFTPTQTQKRALTRALKNMRAGKTLSYNEFVRKLGFRN